MRKWDNNNNEKENKQFSKGKNTTTKKTNGVEDKI